MSRARRRRRLPVENPGKPRRRFGFELQQLSVDELAKEVRKLAIYASGGLGLLGWDAGAGVASAALAFVVWCFVQVVAIAIETVRVYPRKQVQERNGGQRQGHSGASK